MDSLIKWYQTYDEDSRLIKQYSNQIEFDTTIHVIRPYLLKDAAVIELGAATGRYCLKFASEFGCKTTAVEIVPDYVEILRKKAQSQSLPLTVHKGNACDLSFIESGSQTLCASFGPMYHIKAEEDRNKAVQEIWRILKPGGIAAAAYIPKFFVAGYFAKNEPEKVSKELLSSLLETGLAPKEVVYHPFCNDGYFFAANEIEDLFCKHGFVIKRHVATDGLARFVGNERFNKQSPEQYRAYLDYHLKTCDEPSLLGSSNHALVIAYKPG